MSEPEKKKGRPRGKREAHSMTLRLPPSWYEQLRQQAFDEHRSMTELIKDALRDKYHLRAAT